MFAKLSASINCLLLPNTVITHNDRDLSLEFHVEGFSAKLNDSDGKRCVVCLVLVNRSIVQ